VKRLLLLIPLLFLAAEGHAAIAFGNLAEGNDNDVSAAESYTENVTIPSHSNGDGLLAALCYSDSTTNPTPEVTTPSGWTKAGTVANGDASDVRLSLFYKIGDGVESSVAFVGPSNSWGVAWMVASWTGVNSTMEDATAVTNTAGPATSITASAITTATNGAEAIWASCFDDDSGTSADITTNLTTGTLRGFEAVASGGGQNGTTGAFASENIATAGSSGTNNFENNGDSEHAVTITWAIKPAGGSGVYDTAPTVASQTATAYTITGSLDASGTVDSVACLKDQTAPTIAQVQAGDCTGDVAAEDTDTDSPASGPFDFSLTLTPTDAFPIYDLYVTDGTTLTTLADEMLDPPTTCGEGADEACQFITVASIGSGSVFEDFNTAETPDIAANDVITAPTHVSPGLSGGIGTHDGSNNAATLTDSTRSWNDDDYNTLTVSNITDGSSCTITDSTATTIVCTLSGGTDDDWDTGDVYEVKYPLTISTAGHFSYDDFSEGLQQRAFNITIYIGS